MERTRRQLLWGPFCYETSFTILIRLIKLINTGTPNSLGRREDKQGQGRGRGRGRGGSAAGGR